MKYIKVLISFIGFIASVIVLLSIDLNASTLLANILSIIVCLFIWTTFFLARISYYKERSINFTLLPDWFRLLNSIAIFYWVYKNFTSIEGDGYIIYYVFMSLLVLTFFVSAFIKLEKPSIIKEENQNILDFPYERKNLH